MPDKYAIRNWLRANINVLCGPIFSLPTSDRVWLDNWVLANCQGKSVLSVGVAWYTMHLPFVAGPLTAWYTTDPDKSQARFGKTSDVHYELALAELPEYFVGLLDVVILNGVIGYGLNTLPEVQQALAQCMAMLKPGGKLLVGYNDTPNIVAQDIRDYLANSNFSSYELANNDPSKRHMFMEYTNHG